MTTLNESVDAAIENRLSGLHTCLPARVESYNMEKSMVSVTPLIKKVFRNGQVISMPVINNVPLVMPRGSVSSLTIRIVKGDGVMLVFSERALDLWLSKGGEQEPGDRRRFDLSDAIAVPGLFPFAAGSPAEEDATVLRDGLVKVKLKSDKVAIGKDGGDELLDLLDQFLTKMIAATTIDPFSGTPQPFIPTVITDLTLIKTKLTTIRGTL